MHFLAAGHGPATWQEGAALPVPSATAAVLRALGVRQPAYFVSAHLCKRGFSKTHAFTSHEEQKHCVENGSQTTATDHPAAPDNQKNAGDFAQV